MHKWIWQTQLYFTLTCILQLHVIIFIKIRNLIICENAKEFSHPLFHLTNICGSAYHILTSPSRSFQFVKEDDAA